MSYDNAQFSTARLLANGTAGQLSPNAVAPLPAQAGDTVDPAYRAKATEAAVKFESFFIGKMLHQMRDGTRAFAADDSPNKSRINDDMLDMADNLVADQLANRRAFGVADAILRQLLPQPSQQALPQAQAAPTGNVADSQNLNSKTLNQQQ
ncbi:rod-binding protein [Duganella sp. sic0402]|uniref:rod-binding protein n=1 Tax=Duganella sp. sic0402 TaxID=2854786 RepID=UPI001C4508C3|nr:rod-binding protein [Duganella sp. sic0402]MBV7535145.1 rod-binding protein [Duganella sp. sic0402]